MSDSEDTSPGRREVAHRIFGAEFGDATLSYSESDEERAPNYVVTPTGARANRVFVVGVLTELEEVNDEVLRARIVDPTGPFVVYAGQYQPEPLAFLEAATPPVFVAVTGKARTFEPDDGDRVFTSIRPESISEVDADTRDRWIVQTAEQTIERVGRMASAKQTGQRGDGLRRTLTDAGVSESDADGIALALDHYGTTAEYLSAIRDLALNGSRVVAGERDEAGTLSVAPADGTDEGLEGLGTINVDAGGSVIGVSGSDERDEPNGDPTTPAESPEDDMTTTSDDTPTAEPSPPTDETAEPSATTDDTSIPSSTADDTATGSGETLGDFETSGSGTEETSEAVSTEPSGETAREGDIDDVDDFDPEFELDEDEREEIEQEYGTDFQSGTEVSDPGEADIETPEPDAEIDDTSGAEADIDGTPGADTGETPAQEISEVSEPVADDGTETTASEASSASKADPDATATGTDVAEQPPEQSTEADPADADDVDLEDAVMETMAELDSGGGADRDAVIEHVIEQHGVSADDVEAAIQDALMNGRCYEPGDGKLTPI